MFKRRNFLLHCSVLMNVAVLLYVCSHLMIGNDNLALGPAYVIQEDYAVKPPQALIRSNSEASVTNEKFVQTKHQQLLQEQQPKYVDPDSPIESVDSNQVREFFEREKKIIKIYLFGFQLSKGIFKHTFSTLNHMFFIKLNVRSL